LKEKEILADTIILDTERLNEHLESLKEFESDLNVLNKIAREKSNTEMINQINQENPQIREIQAENRQLKAAIDEHQKVIEMIMSKFSENFFDKLEQTKIDFTALSKKYDHGVSF
jgi:predicted RNase H-like nuclease (RuvC/YqgF family)